MTPLSTETTNAVFLRHRMRSEAEDLNISDFKLVDSRNLFVKNLDEAVITNKEDLRRLFEAFGEIESAHLVTCMHSMISKGYGFVLFRNHEDALNAQFQMDGQIIGRSALFVTFAEKKDNRYSRFRSHRRGNYNPAPHNYDNGVGGRHTKTLSEIFASDSGSGTHSGSQLTVQSAALTQADIERTLADNHAVEKGDTNAVQAIPSEDLGKIVESGSMASVSSAVNLGDNISFEREVESDDTVESKPVIGVENVLGNKTVEGVTNQTANISVTENQKENSKSVPSYTHSSDSVSLDSQQTTTPFIKAKLHEHNGNQTPVAASKITLVTPVSISGVSTACKTFYRDFDEYKDAFKEYQTKFKSSHSRARSADLTSLVADFDKVLASDRATSEGSGVSHESGGAYKISDVHPASVE